MTIICVDTKGNVATDSLMVCNGIVVSRTTEKLRVVGNTIYAMAGTRLFWEPLIAWHQAGAEFSDAPKGDKDNDWCLIAIDKDGVWQYDWDAPYPDQLADQPWAWGSNSDVAIGLMLAGKTAAEAVKIMCEKSVWAGGEVQSRNISEALGLQTVREAAE